MNDLSFHYRHVKHFYRFHKRIALILVFKCDYRFCDQMYAIPETVYWEGEEWKTSSALRN
jgi:hypothetical protein